MTIDRSTEATEVERVPLDAIDPAVTSIRAIRVDHTWVARLSECAAEWDPILVTQTLRIIDGLHRYEAAIGLGLADISVQRVAASDEGLRLELAMAANSRHGLPLTMRDRSRMVDLLLLQAPMWSDRRIAKSAAVSASTVGAHRKRLSEGRDPDSGVQFGHLDARIGLDGKVYPVPSVPSDVTAVIDTEPLNEGGRGRRTQRFLRRIRRAARAFLWLWLSIVGLEPAEGTEETTARGGRQSASRDDTQ